MKKLIIIIALFAVGCSHYVSIRSDPPNAEVTYNGRYLGTTPTQVSTSAGFITQSDRILVSKDGYETVDSTIRYDEFRPIFFLSTCWFTYGLTALWSFAPSEQIYIKMKKSEQ